MPVSGVKDSPRKPINLLRVNNVCCPVAVGLSDLNDRYRKRLRLNSPGDVTIVYVYE